MWPGSRWGSAASRSRSRWASRRASARRHTGSRGSVVPRSGAAPAFSASTQAGLSVTRSSTAGSPSGTRPAGPRPADELGWQRFSLIGHSMGGMAIQRVLVEATTRVEKLVALTPVPANGYPFDDAGFAFFASAAESAEVRHKIVDKTTGNRLTGVWIDQIVRYSLENSTREAFAAYLPAWAKGDFSVQVKGNPVPIKVIIGEHDPAINEALVSETYLAWFPNVELEIMANAGHYPMFETPVALATSIESFLKA